MPSESSLKVGSSAARGWSLGELVGLPEGVVDCEARRELREGGRSGVVGREGMGRWVDAPAELAIVVAVRAGESW